jgi:hypothetical protein
VILGPTVIFSTNNHVAAAAPESFNSTTRRIKGTTDPVRVPVTAGVHVTQATVYRTLAVLDAFGGWPGPVRSRERQ